MAYLDTTLNHVQSDLFQDRVAPLMVFFKSKSMFLRLKKLITNTYKVGVEEKDEGKCYDVLCDDSKIVFSKNEKDSVRVCWTSDL